ncbi:DUF4307 domain-containing protein [Nocardioides bizhenqiangii]|uniref:DUF4307 domain-containing protein n=1 Tax=Nocardioides bizhenqiangii TaxID=3095076 RepID=A0ABZ0ZUP2_9ACTN|nr:DUF4307 domain-containing protein [Nocardioides sp. HM61]WQQ27539.1 DUF4307 domain-containing protein [Nocardioides sp. HM61]
MTVHSHSLPQRYGAPPRWRRYVLIGFVMVVVGAFAAVWTWITIAQSDPPVSSELITSEIVDDHTATAVIRVQWGDEAVDAECTVRAIAQDKAIVGQHTFVPDPDAGPDYEVEVATERRATAVENIGCTADGQPRPR